MHEFLITKDSEDLGKDIYGLYDSTRQRTDGSGSRNDSWSMCKTSVRAKPNSQVSDWSPKLWLVRSLPNECSTPDGTPKFHLFRKLTRDAKRIEQTPAELEIKLKDLMKTVAEVAKMKQFDEEDRVWWENFWSVRSRTRARLGGGEEEDCEHDAASLALVRKLLWPDTDKAVAMPATPGGAEEEDDAAATAEVGPLEDLQRVLTPRSTPAAADEFGRSRRTGYVTVGPNEDKEQRFAEAQAQGSAVKKDIVLEHLKNVRNHRGVNEVVFALNKIKVRAKLNCSI